MSTVEIPADLAAWAKDQVAAGRADSIEDVVAKALRQRQMDEEHRALVHEAYESVRQGRFHEGDEVEAELDRWIAEDLADPK